MLSLFDVDVIAYALVESHVHLFVYDGSNSLSNFMMKLHGDYARYYNRVNERVGHVFGERFNNKIVVADIYGKWLSRYIHRQALEAGLVEDSVDYLWSSYRAYVGLEKKEFIKPDVILMQFGDDEDRRRDYRAFVLSQDDGPVDWSKRYFALVVGDDLIHYICQKQNLERSMLMDPQGARERRVRHNAIRILHDQYGYKPALLVRAFGLSRAAMTRILAK